MEYDEYGFELEQRYRKRMDKKMRGKPQVVKIIMSRTFGSSMMILQCLRNISFGELTFALYDFCTDLEFKEIVRLYDAELELAGINPEKFIFDLHPFYSKISNKIRKESKYREFAEFMGMVIRLHNEKKKVYNEQVVGAYLDLVYQTLEYLRTDKFDLTTFPYGVSTEGELLIGPYPMAYSDLPIIEFREAIEKGKKFQNSVEEGKFILGLYQKRGMLIGGINDLDDFVQAQRIHAATTTALFPFINEFTYDIVPLNYYRTQIAPFNAMKVVNCDIRLLKNRLQHRNHTLPTNGVAFEISDESRELTGAMIREIFYHNCVYMLYRIDTDKGSLAGYYDTKEEFLFSTLQDESQLSPYSNLCALILSMYATQVLSNMPIEDLNQKFFQLGQPLKIKAYGKGGKLRNQYNKEKLFQNQHAILISIIEKNDL